MRFKPGESTYNLPKDCVQILNVWFKCGKLQYMLEMYGRYMKFPKECSVYGFMVNQNKTITFMPTPTKAHYFNIEYTTRKVV